MHPSCIPWHPARQIQGTYDRHRMTNPVIWCFVRCCYLVAGRAAAGSPWHQGRGPHEGRQLHGGAWAYPSARGMGVPAWKNLCSNLMHAYAWVCTMWGPALTC